jgi:ferredoxin-NADP reductase
LTTISFRDTEIPVHGGQSVLDALLNQGLDVPYGCRAGVCQSCLVQAKSGTPPASAQIGLKETLKSQNYFLSCSCFPEQDLVLGDFEAVRHSAVVTMLKPLSARVLEVHLRTETAIDYRAGQYITLYCDQLNEGGDTRCYSLASVPSLDDSLVIQVAKVEGGRVSTWIHDHLFKGQKILIQQPMGDCFFVPAHSRQPILLAANGTGLSPLFGILKDALRRGHLGEIHLFHRASNIPELYLNKRLLELEVNHTNFYYHPSVSTNRAGSCIPDESVKVMISNSFQSLEGWQAYFCGSPDLVNVLRKQSYLCGASLNQIFSDAFVASHSNASC